MSLTQQYAAEFDPFLYGLHSNLHVKNWGKVFYSSTKVTNLVNIPRKMNVNVSVQSAE